MYEKVMSSELDYPSFIIGRGNRIFHIYTAQWPAGV
jgi:hypothetical protein